MVHTCSSDLKKHRYKQIYKASVSREVGNGRPGELIDIVIAPCRSGFCQASRVDPSPQTNEAVQSGQRIRIPGHLVPTRELGERCHLPRCLRRSRCTSTAIARSRSAASYYEIIPRKRASSDSSLSTPKYISKLI